MADAELKMDRLRSLVRSTGSAAVAFSGGADSALVTRIAKDELGPRAVAVTVDSPMYPRGELRAAKAVAKSIGIKHLVVKVDPLDDPGFRSNPPDRCYRCKLATFGAVREAADRLSLASVLDGSNADDELEFRPGSRAKDELRVMSPLAKVGLSKKDIAEASRRLRLPTHAKAPSPCLATRVPYGVRLSPELLGRIERAEEYLKRKGFDQVRVRAHGQLARVEVPKDRVGELARPGLRDLVVRRLKSLGFTYVTVDIEGYRSGSLDEVLDR